MTIVPYKYSLPSTASLGVLVAKVYILLGFCLPFLFGEFLGFVRLRLSQPQCDNKEF